jgi:hypothetical protein
MKQLTTANSQTGLKRWANYNYISITYTKHMGINRMGNINFPFRTDRKPTF